MWMTTDTYTLFQKLAHGDEEHRKWLQEAINCVALGKAVPPATGQGTKQALEQRIEELEQEIDNLKRTYHD